MEAANRGASEAGAPSIGFNIRLPREQEPNAYSTPELTFRFHYLAMRNMQLVVFPGGFGTFDELFELLALTQTGKATRIPVVLVDRTYWTSVINLPALVHYGMVRPEEAAPLQFAETAEEAWATLMASGLGSHRDHAKRMGD